VLLGFVRFIGRAIAPEAAPFAAWLVATYPGVAYWGGAAYSYALIVPGLLLLAMLLHALDRAETQAAALGAAMAMGVLFCGYDFFPTFLPTALLVVALRRRFALGPAVAAGLIIPTVISNFILYRQFHVSPLNSNSASYLNVMHSWAMGPDLSQLVRLPQIAAANYFFSNFVILPTLFGALLALRPRLGLPRLDRIEKIILCVTFGIFLFNNLAPSYAGWQLRGSWISRIYQPLFLPLLFYTLRAIPAGGRTVRALVVGTVALSGLIVFGPILHTRPLAQLTSVVYARFYRHSPDDYALVKNLEQYGRRPLGFCYLRNSIQPGSR
jgi:hypothetical protein